MATIGIKVDTNFQQAGAELKKFTGMTKQETDRINRSLKKLETFQADSFIQKNKRIALSVHATRGAAAGLATEQRGLERKIQMLIRNGIDPLDKSLENLQREYARTTRQMEVNARAQRMSAKMAQLTKRAMQGLALAAVGVGIVLLKNANDVAKRGDQFAKTARTIGITAEQLQELNFVAERSGVSQQTMGVALQKLNKNIGDVRAGTGTMTTLLRKQNPALLEQLKNVSNNSQAFDLLMKQMGGMSSAADRAALAQAAFGRAGQGLINVSLLGAEGISELRKEAQKYGLISNEAAKNSEAYMDSQANLNAAITGLKNTLGTALMPVIKDVMDSITNFVGDSEKMKALFKTLIPIIIGLASALIGMLVISKIITIIQGFKTAMLALKVVLAAHPIFLLAGAMVAMVALIAIFSSGSKSIEDFEKEIKSAESTNKKLNAELKISGDAFLVFNKSAKTAAVGSMEYQKSLNMLLKQTPELKQYGITAISTYAEVAQAQTLMNDALKSEQVLKANKQFEKLSDSLEELKINLINAYKEYKNDPTKVNLAAAKKYQALLKRSQIAMQSLGKQSGRTSEEIKTAFKGTSGLARGISEMSDKAVESLKAIKTEAKNVLVFMTDFATKQFSFMAKLSAGIKATRTRKPVKFKDPGFAARIKLWQLLQTWRARYEKDTEKTFSGALQGAIKSIKLTGDAANKYFNDIERRAIKARSVGGLTEIEFASILKTLNKIREDFPIAEYEKLVSAEKKLLKIRISEIGKAGGPASVRVAALITEQQKIAELTKIGIAEKELLIMTAEQRITEIQRVENEKRRQLTIATTGQILESFSSIISAVSDLRSADVDNQIAMLEDQNKRELDNQKLTEEQKIKLKSNFEKKKARLEFEGALKIWRLEKLGAIASGAKVILNGFNTKPFLPAGIIAGAAASVIAGIQIASVNKAKPRLSAETGGSFVVPNNPASGRLDSGLLRVNPGEQVDVTPRGEDAGRKTIVNVQLDKRLLYSVMQEGFDNGEITITNDNLVA